MPFSPLFSGLHTTGASLLFEDGALCVHSRLINIYNLVTEGRRDLFKCLVSRLASRPLAKSLPAFFEMCGGLTGSRTTQ